MTTPIATRRSASGATRVNPAADVAVEGRQHSARRPTVDRPRDNAPAREPIFPGVRHSQPRVFRPRLRLDSPRGTILSSSSRQLRARIVFDARDAPPPTRLSIEGRRRSRRVEASRNLRRRVRANHRAFPPRHGAARSRSPVVVGGVLRERVRGGEMIGKSSGNVAAPARRASQPQVTPFSPPRARRDESAPTTTEGTTPRAR